MSAFDRTLVRPGVPAKRGRGSDKQQKLILAAAGGLLLVVLALQGPKLVKELSNKSSSTTAAPAAGGVTTAPATGNPAPAAHAARRISLHSLPARDLFVPLVSDGSSGSGATSSPAGTGQQPAYSVQPATQAQSSSSTGGAAAAAQSTAGAAAAKGSSAAKTGSSPAVKTTKLWFNGASIQVGVHQAFPASKPMFRLVGVAPKYVRIGVVGGVFSNGKRFVQLARGQGFVLSNTATGERYLVRFGKAGKR